jgi:hypothetical protein
MMTDAVTAYGDERETIGRLAYYRKELADDDRTDELAKVRNLRQAGRSTRRKPRFPRWERGFHHV